MKNNNEDYNIAEEYNSDNIVDRHPEQKYFIKGWFNRINDISRKCGCDTIFKSKHF
jgi:hypothetical protein